MPAAPPRWAAPLAAAVACSAFALWNPPLRDLAAHTFRADFFEDHGFAIWNNSWYGGHYLLSYSVLFPPLAALLSPVWAAAAAAVASAWLFDRIVRERWGDAGGVGGAVVRRCSAPSRCSQTGGSCSRSASPSASARCGRCSAGRRAAAVALAVGAALASPVAAAFLALVCAVGALYSARRAALLTTVAAALVPLAVLGLLFPESGQFPFWFSAWWPLALFCVLALVGHARRRERTATCARVLVAYLALATLVRAAAQPARRQHDAARARCSAARCCWPCCSRAGPRA